MASTVTGLPWNLFEVNKEDTRFLKNVKEEEPKERGRGEGGGRRMSKVNREKEGKKEEEKRIRFRR